jgi:hypothetical protein
VATPAYAVCRRRSKSFVLDSKPEALRHLDLIDAHAWKQYQTYLARVSPLERAEFYARQMKERALPSAEALSKIVGESADSVRRHLRLLDLPAQVRDHLHAQRTPENLRFFSLRELLKLVRVGDPKAILREFRELLAQAKREARLWASDGKTT